MIHRLSITSPEDLRSAGLSDYVDGDILLVSMTELMLGHLTCALFRLASGWSTSGETDDGIMFIQSSVDLDKYWERVCKGIPKVFSSGPQTLTPLTSYTVTHDSDSTRRRLIKMREIVANVQTLGDINFTPTAENVEFITTPNEYVYPFDWSQNTVKLFGGLKCVREGSDLFPASAQDVLWKSKRLTNQGDLVFLGTDQVTGDDVLLEFLGDGSGITGSKVCTGNLANVQYIQSVSGDIFAYISGNANYQELEPGDIGSNSFALDGNSYGGYGEFVCRAAACLGSGNIIASHGTLLEWQWPWAEPNDTTFYLFTPSGSGWSYEYIANISSFSGRASSLRDGWPYAPNAGLFVITGIDYGGSNYNRCDGTIVLNEDGSDFNLANSGGYTPSTSYSTMHFSADPSDGKIVCRGVYGWDDTETCVGAHFSTNTGGMVGGLTKSGYFMPWNVRTQDRATGDPSLLQGGSIMVDDHIVIDGVVYRLTGNSPVDSMAAVIDAEHVSYTPAFSGSYSLINSVPFSATKFLSILTTDAGQEAYVWELVDANEYKSAAILLKDVIADAISITSMTANSVEPAGTELRFLVADSAGNTYIWSGAAWISHSTITTGNTTAEFNGADHSLLVALLGHDVSIKVGLITTGADTPELTSIGVSYSRGEDFKLSNTFLTAYAESDITTRAYNHSSSITYTIEFDVYIF